MPQKVTCTQLQYSGLIALRSIYHASPNVYYPRTTAYTYKDAISYCIGCISGFCSAHVLEPLVAQSITNWYTLATQHPQPSQSIWCSILTTSIPPTVTWALQHVIAHVLSRGYAHIYPTLSDKDAQQENGQEREIWQSFHNGVILGVDVHDLYTSKNVHNIYEILHHIAYMQNV